MAELYVEAKAQIPAFLCVKDVDAIQAKKSRSKKKIFTTKKDLVLYHSRFSKRETSCWIVFNFKRIAALWFARPVELQSLMVNIIIQPTTLDSRVKIGRNWLKEKVSFRTKNTNLD